MGKKYRNAVIAVFVDVSNRVLVLERSDFPGSWQLPQGGVEEGESFKDAVLREMKEELGTESFQVISEGGVPTKYDFPEELTANISKKYAGQELHWFLMKFSMGGQPDLENAQDKEFINYKWVSWEEAVELVTEWKKEVYQTGFELLGFK